MTGEEQTVDGHSPEGIGGKAPADPRDLSEPWARPETDSLTPERMMAFIRARCPWAQAHTHRSLLPYLLEETVELWAAVLAEESARTDGAVDPSAVVGAAGEGGGPGETVEAELADVLYQVLFHAALLDDRRGREPGETWTALQGRIVEKYVGRHPHVFDSDGPVELTEVQRRYQEVKAQEKARSGAAPEPPPAAHCAAGAEAAARLAEVRETMERKNRHS